MPINKKRIIALIVVVLLIVGSVYLYQLFSDPRNGAFLTWFRGTESDREALMTRQGDVCAGAPFLLPSEGFIGLLYADPRGPYSRLNPHQGIDIFSIAEPGVVPVYAAYDGYITRENDWRSTLIQRVPEDPLEPTRQIWLYYTHMADRDGNDFIVDAFPPGTREVFVEQGELLGYVGNYSGNPANPVGTHLHFSIIRDNGFGSYTNELEFGNSFDPTPYLGLSVDYRATSDYLEVVRCEA